MINLQTSIKTLTFSCPFFNASGVWCTSEKELKEIGESESGAIITKSMTIKKRQGNEEPRLYFDNYLSVNSMGLPNRGYRYYCQIASNLKKFKKPLIASIAGFSFDDYLFLSDKVEEKDFDAIEVNLSCPNILGKKIFAYDLDLSLTILEKIRKKTKKVLGVKLPPYNSRSEIEYLAKRLVEVGVDYASLINSLPLSAVVDVEKEKLVITPNMGIGGLGGEGVKPVALAHVILFRYYSQNKLEIVGVGGVKSGEDVYQYLLAGAKAVAVGTALLREGPKIFFRLKKELEEILKKKKISYLKEKIGKLKKI